MPYQLRVSEVLEQRNASVFSKSPYELSLDGRTLKLDVLHPPPPQKNFGNNLKIRQDVTTWKTSSCKVILVLEGFMSRGTFEM
jgi:hypothetical protein